MDSLDKLVKKDQWAHEEIKDLPDQKDNKVNVAQTVNQVLLGNQDQVENQEAKDQPDNLDQGYINILRILLLIKKKNLHNLAFLSIINFWSKTDLIFLIYF